MRASVVARTLAIEGVDLVGLARPRCPRRARRGGGGQPRARRAALRPRRRTCATHAGVAWEMDGDLEVLDCGRAASEGTAPPRLPGRVAASVGGAHLPHLRARCCVCAAPGWEFLDWGAPPTSAAAATARCTPRTRSPHWCCAGSTSRAAPRAVGDPGRRGARHARTSASGAERAFAALDPLRWPMPPIVKGRLPLAVLGAALMFVLSLAAPCVAGAAVSTRAVAARRASRRARLGPPPRRRPRPPTPNRRSGVPVDNACRGAQALLGSGCWRSRSGCRRCARCAEIPRLLRRGVPEGAHPLAGQLLLREGREGDRTGDRRRPERAGARTVDGLSGGVAMARGYRGRSAGTSTRSTSGCRCACCSWCRSSIPAGRCRCCTSTCSCCCRSRSRWRSSTTAHI